MSSNDITGDALRSRLSNDNFNKNWDKIMAEQNKHDKDCASRNKWLPVTPPRRADCDCWPEGKKPDPEIIKQDGEQMAKDIDAAIVEAIKAK